MVAHSATAMWWHGACGTNPPGTVRVVSVGVSGTSPPLPGVGFCKFARRENGTEFFNKTGDVLGVERSQKKMGSHVGGHRGGG